MASDGYWLGVGWAGLGWGTIPDRVATYDGYLDKVVPQRNRTTCHNKPSACDQNQVMQNASNDGPTSMPPEKRRAHATTMDNSTRLHPKSPRRACDHVHVQQTESTCDRTAPRVGTKTTPAATMGNPTNLRTCGQGHGQQHENTCDTLTTPVKQSKHLRPR